MSEPRKSIRAMDMKMDRLSALPEPLLLRILEFLVTEKVGNGSINLGLKGLKEAAKTSVLSKRWRSLWANLPSVYMNESRDFEEIRSFVAMVSAALAARRAPLDSLFVLFHFDKRFASAVDSWVDHAAESRVKSLTLSLDRDLLYKDDDVYALTQIIYSVSSLTSLVLRNCFLTVPETAVEWGRLKMLSISSTELPQEAIDAIVTGSPFLETLSLSRCSGFDRLEIGGRKFRRLTVEVCRRAKGAMEISAPYARHLSLAMSCYSITRKSASIPKVRVRNAPSLESAGINFYARETLSLSETAMGNAVEIFQDFGHVKDLHLSEGSIKVVSFMATKGWKLHQLIRVEGLHVEAASYVQSIYGVIAMLESSPYVEKLYILGSEPGNKSIDWGPNTRDDLNSDLLHLKTVRFERFFESNVSDEPTLSLARILLKRAPNLESMVLRRDYFSTSNTEAVIKTLLDHPKASTKASII